MNSSARKKQTKRPEKALSPVEIVDRLFTGHAAEVMKRFPPGSIDLIVTSPPYWNAVEYDHGKSPWQSYEDYLGDVQSVWLQCSRVLRPNGKLCINAPIMPIPKEVIDYVLKRSPV